MSMLGVIAEQMAALGVPYEFMEWTSPVEYPYFIGEYSEVPSVTEDGYKETSFMVTGTTRGTWLELEQFRAKIEKHFPAVNGLRIPTADGAVIIIYENSFPVPTGEADLKRIQINLQVKEWRNAQWL